MRTIFVLVKKEIKELLTVSLLIPIVIMVLFFFFIGRLMKGEIKKASKPSPVYVIDNDKTETSQGLINALKQRNLIVTELDLDIDSALLKARNEKVNNILLLPESLEQNLKYYLRPSLRMYTLINSLSPFSDISGAQVKSALNVINESLSVKIIRQIKDDAPISSIRRPLNVIDYVRLKNQIIQENPVQIKNAIRVQNVFIPVILLMVIIYISQMIGAAMGQEKENKTLETLLTFPVSRFKILVGKMFGAASVAILLSVVFLIGMRFYVTPMTQLDAPSATAAKTMINIGPSQTTLFGVLTLTLFLAIICAASLATLLTIFATDAKQAQVIITPINILAVFPYFIALLLDINSLSVFLKIILYINPFTYPFITAQALFFNQIPLIIGGMIYMILFAVATTFIAAKIFSSDRVLTAKLKLKK
jgi:ABC-2 type transport system permease protein